MRVHCVACAAYAFNIQEKTMSVSLAEIQPEWEIKEIGAGSKRWESENF